MLTKWKCRVCGCWYYLTHLSMWGVCDRCVEREDAKGGRGGAA